MAITGLTAAPARAGDTGRVLAGLAALAVLGIAVKEHRDRKRERQQVSRDLRPDIPVWKEEPRHHGSRNRPGGDFPLHPQLKPRPLPQDLQRYVLPRQCLRELNSLGDRKLVVGERCMQRNFGHMRRLPQNCRLEARTERGPRRGYSLECLENRGYRLSRN
ncbi:MAG: hypothetical protein ACK5MY_12495 [Jhaorihella sp.]